MTPIDPLSRPIGWWLKEADARIERAFAGAFAGRDVDRRGWQVLNTIAPQARRRADLAGALEPFDDAASVDAVVDELVRRGWLREDDGLLTLTADGTAVHAALAAAVHDVRMRVRQALGGDDYVTLVTLLQRLVDHLADAAPAGRGED